MQQLQVDMLAPHLMLGSHRAGYAASSQHNSHAVSLCASCLLLDSLPNQHKAKIVERREEQNNGCRGPCACSPAPALVEP